MLCNDRSRASSAPATRHCEKYQPSLDGSLKRGGKGSLSTNQGLGEDAESPAALQLAFSVPVTSLSVDFAMNDLITNPPGELVLVTPSGSISQPGLNVGAAFQGGTLIFNAATPFSSAVLQGFLAPPPAAATAIAIDNLHLTEAVPGPIAGADVRVIQTGCGPGRRLSQEEAKRLLARSE